MLRGTHPKQRNELIEIVNSHIKDTLPGDSKRFTYLLASADEILREEKKVSVEIF